MRPIKEKLPLDIGYGKLKFVLAMLEVTFGIKGESPGDVNANTSTIPAFIRSSSTPNSQSVCYVITLLFVIIKSLVHTGKISPISLTFV